MSKCVIHAKQCASPRIPTDTKRTVPMLLSITPWIFKQSNSLGTLLLCPMQQVVLEFQCIRTSETNLLSNINHHVEMRKPCKTLRVSKNVWILHLSHRYIGQVLAEGLLISHKGVLRMLQFDLHLNPTPYPRSGSKSSRHRGQCGHVWDICCQDES